MSLLTEEYKRNPLAIFYDSEKLSKSARFQPGLTCQKPHLLGRLLRQKLTTKGGRGFFLREVEVFLREVEVFLREVEVFLGR